MIVRGIDTDNYDGMISVERFRRLHDNDGVRFNIIGLEAQMPYARQQEQASLEGGLSVPFCYKFPYWVSSDLERMKQAAGFGYPVAIDCEYGTGMPGGREATVERIQQCKDVLLAEGRYWGIYTGVWWWVPHTGDSHAFAGDNGWHAGYPFNKPNQPPVLPPADYLPNLAQIPDYGGLSWKCWQYADICYGEPSFDMNAMELVAPVPIPDPHDKGIFIEGDFVNVYNGPPLPVVRFGGRDFPGRISKLFGDKYLWLRVAANGTAYWSEEEGD